jgi:NarL family two-component system response regulator YdfI
VLILSGHDDRAHILNALKAGADDYLLKKNSTPQVLVSHILRALAKTLPMQDEVHVQILQALRSVGKEGFNAGLPELSCTEMELLKLAAYQGASAKEMVRALGGKMSLQTVWNHWQHIYDKLGVQSQPQAVCMAIKVGLIGADPALP